MMNKRKPLARAANALLSLVLALGLLPAVPAVASASEGLGSVHVTVENTTFAVADGALWEGVLVEADVELRADDNMAECVRRAVTGANKWIQVDDSSYGPYISAIQGLEEFDGGEVSGWMGTLNDWFTSKGFGNYRVADGTLRAGDEIRVMYTCQGMGFDLGKYGMGDMTLSSLSVSAGDLDQVFSPNVYSYTLTLPRGVSSVDVAAKAADREYLVRVTCDGVEYRRGAGVAVADGSRILVTCGKGDRLEPEAEGATVYAIDVTVEERAGILLSDAQLSFYEGYQRQLSAQMSDGSTTAGMTWETSDSSVATVDENGLVKGVAPGTAVITARLGEVFASCAVEVLEREIPAGYLASLSFWTGTSASAAEYELSPAFSPDVDEYTMVVPSATTSVNAKCLLPYDDLGPVTVCYANTYGTAKEVTLASGASSPASIGGVLKNGSLQGNDMVVKVGDREAYTVHIVRAETLAKLAISGASLDRAYNYAVLGYSAVVSSEGDVTVTATPKSSAGTVAVNGVEVVGGIAAVTPEWSGHRATLTITASGEGAVSTVYTVELTCRPARLEVARPADKLTYKVGEAFDCSGMTLQAVYADGSRDTLEPGSYSVSPDEGLIGVDSVTFAYMGVTCTQAVALTGALTGAGTAEDPFLIQSADDADAFARMVNAGVSFQGQYLALTCDVTLNEGWVPAGKTVDGGHTVDDGNLRAFCGSLDGCGHTVTVPEGGRPLLGCVNGAIIHDLNVYGAYIAGPGLIEHMYAFSRQGKHLSGTSVVIRNVTIKSGTRTEGSGLYDSELVTAYGNAAAWFAQVSDCTVEAGVTIGCTGDRSQIGSFAGRFQGIMENCVSHADVRGIDFVGGIVGTRDNAMNPGGDAGYVVVRGCAFDGTVEGRDYVGGIAGGGYDDAGKATAPNAGKISVEDCSCSGIVTGRANVGGILGGDPFVAQSWDNSSSYVTGNSFTGLVSGQQNVGAVIGGLKSLNRCDVVEGNTYAAGCGATAGIGFVLYLDTSCQTAAVSEGGLRFSTESSTADCPEVRGCGWKEGMNRTDDPLGADAQALCRMVVPEGVLLGDANNSGTVNIVDAQVVYDLARGTWGEDCSQFPLSESWSLATLRYVSNVNGDDAIDGVDAFAIQRYVHYGKFGE